LTRTRDELRTWRRTTRSKAASAAGVASGQAVGDGWLDHLLRDQVGGVGGVGHRFPLGDPAARERTRHRDPDHHGQGSGYDLDHDHPGPQRALRRGR
jgi:hypothetical protein